MDFAFLVHARDHTDIARKFKIAKYLPKRLVEFWCLHWPPFVVTKIDNLKPDNSGKTISGCLIGIPMTAKQMLDNRDLAMKKTVEAVKKAEKMGAKYVGLGALTAPVTKGGTEIIDKFPGTTITNGNTLTAVVSIHHIMEKIKSNQNIETVAVVGATGSIGQAITLALAQKTQDKKINIYARTKENIINLINKARESNPNLKIEGFSGDLSTLNTADLIAVATSASSAIIKKEHLKQNVIVYDVTQPQNVDKAILKTRPDVTLIDGGLSKIPFLKNKMPFGLPPQVVFSCFAETMLLAAENMQSEDKQKFVGPVKQDNIQIIREIFNKYGLIPELLNLKK
jgi:predicted amino acid dehydrogenase